MLNGGGWLWFVYNKQHLHFASLDLYLSLSAFSGVSWDKEKQHTSYWSLFWFFFPNILFQFFFFLFIITIVIFYFLFLLSLYLREWVFLCYDIVPWRYIIKAIRIDFNIFIYIYILYRVQRVACALSSFQDTLYLSSIFFFCFFFFFPFFFYFYFFSVTLGSFLTVNSLMEIDSLSRRYT